MHKDSVVLDTSREVFPSLIGKKWYKTVGFKQLAIIHGTLTLSYRRTTEILNRVRHQPKATPLRTLQDTVEAEGESVAAEMQAEASRQVRESGISPETLCPTQEVEACEVQHLSPSLVDAAMRKVAPDEQTLEAMRNNPVGYEEPKVTACISMDDVLSKKQKEHRKKREQQGAQKQEQSHSKHERGHKRTDKPQPSWDS